MIGKTISHYKIFEKLGSGGMGDVYKAKDTKLQRTVALKFLPFELTRDEEAQQRFVHEARTASAFDHPNIGTIYEINEEEGRTFIAMAYYEGDTLKDKIDANKTGLELEECLNIAIQIADGLSKAHSKEIIHRDIKPANILMTEEGQVKIIDFGLAKLKGQTILTKECTTLGTVAYMSPEQTQGDAVDHRTDIWSLGVMLYEMLAGERPFKGDYEQAVIYSILNEEPEFITKVRAEMPGQIEQILEKALTKNPELRFLTMEEMLEALNEITEELKTGQVRKGSSKLGRKQLRIALMPLKSLNNDIEQEWLTESMTDAMITDLAKIGGLRVISRSSAMAYKGTEKTPPEIASELDIQYLIEGSIVKVGDQIKISARLIDAPNNEYIWAENYKSEFTGILGLQGEIAQSIAGHVQIELTPQEETLLAVTRKVNPKTHELYLKGMYHLNKYTPEGFQKGLELLHQAAENDPDEPLAHAGLAIGYNMLAHSPSPPPDALSKAKTATLKALELDANLAEAHFSLGEIKIYSEWDREGAEKSLRRALELNPSLALCRAHLAFLIIIKGNIDEGYEELYKSQELDPLSPLYPAWTGWGYYWTGEYDKSIKEAKKSLELVNDFPIGLYALGSGYAGKGMFKEAIEVHKKAGQISPEWKWGLGVTYALAGRKDEARQIAVELGNKENVWVTWGIAEIYAALGEKDEAFFWLEKAYEQRHPYIQWIRRTVSLKNLHDDPRFDDLAKRLNLSVICGEKKDG